MVCFPLFWLFNGMFLCQDDQTHTGSKAGLEPRTFTATFRKSVMFYARRSWLLNEIRVILRLWPQQVHHWNPCAQLFTASQRVITGSAHRGVLSSVSKVKTFSCCRTCVSCGTLSCFPLVSLFSLVSFISIMQILTPAGLGLG